MARHKKGTKLGDREVGEVVERLRSRQGVSGIQRDTGISSGAIYKIKKELVPRLRICGETITTCTDGTHVARYARLEVAAVSKVEAPGSWAWGEIKSRGLPVPLHWVGLPYTPEESSAPRIIIGPQHPAHLDVALALPPPERRGVLPSLENASGQISSVAVVLNERGYFERDDFSGPVWHGEGCWLAQPVALYNPDQRLAAYLPPGRYGLKVTVGCVGGEGDERYYTLVSPESWQGLQLKPC